MLYQCPALKGVDIKKGYYLNGQFKTHLNHRPAVNHQFNGVDTRIMNPDGKILEKLLFANGQLPVGRQVHYWKTGRLVKFCQSANLPMCKTLKV